MPVLSTYSGGSSAYATSRSPYTSTSSYTSSYNKPPLSSTSTSLSSPLTYRSRSSYDLTSYRSYSPSTSMRLNSSPSSSLSYSSYSSTSSNSSSSSTGSSYYRPSSTTSSVSGLSSSPCSVTLTRFNQRRSSLDYNENDADSSALKQITTGSSYLYSPLSRRRKYSLKGDENDNTDKSAKLPSLVTGLSNLGNTCYMNSVLQALYATEMLRTCVVNNKRSSLMSALGRLFDEMRTCDPESYVSPTFFRGQFIKYQPKFRGYEQQDAQEFLRYLVNGLHDEINVAKKRPRGKVFDPPKSATEAWEQYKTIDDSPIIDAVGGQLSSLITCSACNNTSTCWDPFWDLSLPLPQKLQECDVEQCFAEFTSIEQLDNEEKPMCENCKKPMRSTKRLSIEKAPSILILHLKRFTNEGYKLTTPRITVNNRLFVKSKSYSLYACVSHHGNSSRSGHYTAYCQYASKWYHFNDEKVTEAKNFVCSDLEDCYILFYLENNYTSRL